MNININTLVNRFFGRDEVESSKIMAKERLRLVLIHDRLDVSEQTMNALRVDLINVIGKYFDLDEQALDVSLSRETDGMALVANIPIRRQKQLIVEKQEAQESAPAPKQTKSKRTPKQGTVVSGQ